MAIDPEVQALLDDLDARATNLEDWILGFGGQQPPPPPPSAGPVQSAIGGNNGFSATATLVNATVEGNVLIAVASHVAVSTQTAGFTAAGFTHIASKFVGNQSAGHIAVFAKEVTSALENEITAAWQGGDGRNTIVYLEERDDVDFAILRDFVFYDSGSSISSVALPVVNADQGDGLLAVAFVENDDWTGTAWTNSFEEQQQHQRGGAGPDATMSAATFTAPTTDSYATAFTKTAGSDAWGWGVLLALKAAP